VTPTALDEAKQALDRGEFDRALALTKTAHEASPDDPEVRELYAAVHLARAIRVADRAREARRQDLIRRQIDYEVDFQDSPEVAQAYDEALAAIEDVLRVQPDQWKALMLKASLLFRRDREAGRPQALEILRRLEAADPTNRQVPYTMRKIERPCERCTDTGFCPYCAGRGIRTFLGLERKCSNCYGRGICPACGVL